MVVKRVTLLAVATLALSLSSGYAAGRMPSKTVSIAKAFCGACEQIYVHHHPHLLKVMTRASCSRDMVFDRWFVVGLYEKFNKAAKSASAAIEHPMLLAWLNAEASAAHERGEDLSDVLNTELRLLDEHAWSPEERKAVCDFARLVNSVKLDAMTMRPLTDRR